MLKRGLMVILFILVFFVLLPLAMAPTAIISIFVYIAAKKDFIGFVFSQFEKIEYKILALGDE